MNESQLKGVLVKELRLIPGFVVIPHQERFSHGIPDLSVTGHKITSWLEIKHANPGFAFKGIQELTMLRLALAGNAFYVVYYQSKLDERRTYIVSPNEIGKPMSTWINFVEGFDHRFVVRRIQHDHQ